MGIPHRLSAGPAIEIGMHHLPDDGPRPNDRHLHDDVVKGCRFEARQRGHLRARLDLKHTDCVGFLKQFVDDRIVLGKMCKVDVTTIQRRARRDRGGCIS